MAKDNGQLRFGFSEGAPHTSGVDTWRASRRAAMEELARKNGIPLGRKVQVTFEAGPPLEGLLLLETETLFLPDKKDAHLCLRIGTASFHKDEVASIIVVDEADPTGA